MKKFKINEVKLDYCRDIFNCAYENERSIEVSIGRYFLDKFKGDIIEVGAVLCYYGNDSHIIYDISDNHAKNIKKNALELDFNGKNVLCISTIEHLSSKEYGNTSDQDAITLLNKLITAKNYLITYGIGYHIILDEYVKNHPEIPRFIMKRINWKNDWEKDPDSNNFNYQFGHSDKEPIPNGFNNANGLTVITNLPELL